MSRFDNVPKLKLWQNYFSMGTILVLALRLGCHLDMGLVPHFAGCLGMMLCFGPLCVIFYVLTSWLRRYWDVVPWGSYRNFLPMWPVCSISARVAFLCCVAFLSASFTRVNYFVRHSVASLPGFAGRFAAALDDVSRVAASETRACWFRWAEGWLLLVGTDLMFSRYVIVDGVRQPFQPTPSPFVGPSRFLTWLG